MTAAALTTLAAATVAVEDPAPMPLRDTVVIDFTRGAEAWPRIDDVVMGGVSRSSMTVVDGRAVFSGYLSLESGGGFASVRSRPATYDLGGHGGLVLRVRGDGKRYGLRLRTIDALDGVSYQLDLEPPAGEWTEVRLPFDGFRPVFRGRLVRGHEPLDPAKIRTFGLIIAGKQAGPFRLEIAGVRAYRQNPP